MTKYNTIHHIRFYYYYYLELSDTTYNEKWDAEKFTINARLNILTRLMLNRVNHRVNAINPAALIKTDDAWWTCVTCKYICPSVEMSMLGLRTRVDISTSGHIIILACHTRHHVSFIYCQSHVCILFYPLRQCSENSHYLCQLNCQCLTHNRLFIVGVS